VGMLTLAVMLPMMLEFSVFVNHANISCRRRTSPKVKRKKDERVR
jgi:hypothetical protein